MQRPPVLVIPVGSTGSAFYNALNTNFTLLADALEKALDRFGSLPNQMESHLDMNSFRIINCADPINPSDVVTLRHLRNEIASYIAATKVTWRGMWAPGVSYEPWDLVHHNGSVYICINPHNSTLADEPGVGPSWNTQWDLFLGYISPTWPATSVNVNACPTGPINSNTDAQSAFCTLSNSVNNLNNNINNIINGTTPPNMDLNDLQDVNAPAPALNQALFWNGTVWVPADINPANIQINACPTGPVNTNMDLQSAICSLSSSAGSEVAVYGVSTPQLIPANTKFPLDNAIKPASFINIAPNGDITFNSDTLVLVEAFGGRIASTGFIPRRIYIDVLTVPALTHGTSVSDDGDSANLACAAVFFGLVGQTYAVKFRADINTLDDRDPIIIFRAIG